MPFVSRSKLALPVTPQPPPPTKSWGHTFTNAAGVIFAVDSLEAVWKLAPCHLCLHVNRTLLAQGKLPAGTLQQLAPRLGFDGSVGSLDRHQKQPPQWMRLRLELRGFKASGFILNVQVFAEVDVSSAPAKGFAGFGMGNFTAGLFDDFSVATIDAQ